MAYLIERKWYILHFKRKSSHVAIIDFGYFGIPFLYSNKQQGMHNVRARLNRAEDSQDVASPR